MSYLLLNLMTTYNYEVDIIYNSRNTRLRRDFPRPPGEWRRRRHAQGALGAHLPPPLASVKEKRIEQIGGACGAPCFGRCRRPFQGAPAAPIVLKTSTAS